ncbi:MAG TPA: D-alanyl-D-alanine carboxypeptidase family protein [Xanthobacteraceae bacterium]|nr:D-alanyl-D-alanine carboxypeptidase family protein [Xanthobacteraceae bacterium]
MKSLALRRARRPSPLVICALVALPLAAIAATAPGQKKEEFATAAPYAILIDADSGSVLFDKAADQATPPSSMAKLMTSEVVFHELTESKLKLDDEFQVSEDAWRRGGAPSHTSSMFAPIYSRVRVQDLLTAAIVQSANDACIALAQGIAGNETAFAIKMNARAKEIGLTSSNFTNATGLPDPGLKSTVRDLAKLAQYLIKTYPDFYKYYGEKEFTWNKIRQQNRNPLLAMNIGADGLKTGYTEDGGYGLVGSAERDGLRLIVVINGLKSEKERGEEGRRLLEWGFHGFETKMLFAEGQIVGEARLFGGEQMHVPLVGQDVIALMVPRGNNDRISAKVVYNGPVMAPVARGQPIGKLRVSRGDRVALEAPLIAAESVGRGGMARRALDAVGELVIGLIRSGARLAPAPASARREGNPQL